MKDTDTINAMALVICTSIEDGEPCGECKRTAGKLHRWAVANNLMLGEDNSAKPKGKLH